MRKYGTGEVIPDEEDLAKTAKTTTEPDPQERKVVLSEVLAEDRESD